MKEVKNPKKPLAYYYTITLIALVLFNIFVAPMLNRQRVVETDYSTFMRMIEEKQIGKVDVSDTEIVFTDKNDGTIYVTGVMYDPTLTQRLYDCGAATVRLYRTLFLTPFRFFGTALLAAFLTHIGVRLAVLFCLVFYHVDKIPRRNAEKEKHKYNKKRDKDYKRAGKAEG